MKLSKRHFEVPLYYQGARHYLVGATKLMGKIYYQISNDRDLAYRFGCRYKANTARELIDGKINDTNIIFVRGINMPVSKVSQ